MDGSNDLVISFDPEEEDDMIRVHKQPVNLRIKQIPKWTRPLSPPAKRNPESYWYFCVYNTFLFVEIVAFSAKRWLITHEVIAY